MKFHHISKFFHFFRMFFTRKNTAICSFLASYALLILNFGEFLRKKYAKKNKKTFFSLSPYTNLNNRKCTCTLLTSYCAQVPTLVSYRFWTMSKYQIQWKNGKKSISPHFKPSKFCRHFFLQKKTLPYVLSRSHALCSS